MDAFQATERAMEEKRYRDAIAGCEQALLTTGLQIFPQLNQFRDRRTQVFELLHNQGLSLLAGAITADKRGSRRRESRNLTR